MCSIIQSHYRYGLDLLNFGVRFQKKWHFSCKCLHLITKYYAVKAFCKKCIKWTSYLNIMTVFPSTQLSLVLKIQISIKLCTGISTPLVLWGNWFWSILVQCNGAILLIGLYSALSPFWNKLLAEKFDSQNILYS